MVAPDASCHLRETTGGGGGASPGGWFRNACTRERTMAAVELADLVATSARVTATTSRLAKVEAIAGCLRAAGPAGAAVAVAYLAGAVRQRRLGIGTWALGEPPPPAAVPGLTLEAVDRAFAEIEALAGPGAAAARRERLRALLGQATVDEQHFLTRLVLGALRQGALAGLVTEAVARAGGVEASEVRRAAMLGGELAEVAAALLGSGRDGLAAFRLAVGRPVRPMLAATAPSLAAAVAELGDAAVEWKLDGVRIQVHRAGRAVAVFTRTLEAITERVPELVEAALALPVRQIVLDGEAIALHPDGRPRPFQETAARTATRTGVEALRNSRPLTPFFFDCLHLDGDDLFDRPAQERIAAVAAVVPPPLWVPRVVTGDLQVASGVLDEALGRGHEGVVLKALPAPYEAGRRGRSWLKVKPRHTLDLVVLAAE